MRFDGVAQRYEVTPNVLGSTTTNGWMIEAWVRPQPGGSGLGMIVSHGHGGLGQVLNYDAAANRYGWFVGGTGQFNGSIGATGIGTAWDHLALVRDGGITKLYVNGVLAGSNSAGGGTYANGSAIGSQYTGGSNFGFTGDIDEVYFSTVSGFNVLTDLHMTDPADPVIVVPTTPQDAGTIVASTTTNFDVVIGNSGTVNTLAITAVTGLTGDIGKFSLQTGLPLNIPPGASGTLTFRYAPGAAVASHTATFAIGNNAPNNSNPSVTLTGNAIADPNLVPPSALNFGTVSSTVTTTLPLVVTNSGTHDDLTATAAIVSGDIAWFTATLAPGAVAPGGVKSIQIAYNPQGHVGVHNAVLEISHNDPDIASPIQVTLTGNSVLSYSSIAHYKLGEDDSGLATSVDSVRGYDVANINGSPGTSHNTGSGAAGSTMGINVGLNDVYSHSGVPTELSGRTKNWGIEAWIRPELATGSAQMGAGYGGLYFGVGNGSRGGFSIFSLDGSHWGFNIGGIAAVTSTVPIRGSTWTHVAVVALDSEIRLYVNGALALTRPGLAYAPDDNAAGHPPLIEIGGQVANSYRTSGGFDDAYIFTFASGMFDPAADLHIIPPADADGDGISDLWEDRYFGNHDGIVTWTDLTTTDGSGDADGDGLTNMQEYLQGSDPTNASDTGAPVTITEIKKAGNVCTITFTGTMGKAYALKKSLTLLDGFPTEVGRITLTGTSAGAIQDTTAIEPEAFYRVEPVENP